MLSYHQKQRMKMMLPSWIFDDEMDRPLISFEEGEFTVENGVVVPAVLVTVDFDSDPSTELMEDIHFFVYERGRNLRIRTNSKKVIRKSFCKKDLPESVYYV